MKDSDVSGEYYLEGVMEVASGFQLREDHSFEFFFTYGAVDRQGKGTWKLIGDKIIFNSDSWPGTDFKLVTQESRKNKEIIIQVTDRNTQILGYIGCKISGGGKSQELQTNQDGSVVFELQEIDTISLYHQFFSDQLSVFPIENDGGNYFQFTFQPWLGMVYFKNFSLSVDQDGLTGGHPLKPDGSEYTYTKNN